MTLKKRIKIKSPFKKKKKEIQKVNEAKITFPSDLALVSLFASSKRNSSVGPKVKKELQKLNFVDRSGKITPNGKKFLGDKEVKKKLKDLGS